MSILAIPQKQKNKSLASSLAAIALLALVQGAFALPKAATEEPRVFESEEEKEVIVVTATRTEKRLEDVPIPLEVISAKQIEQQNAKDLSSALSYARGLLIQPIHGKTGDSVKIQGIDSDRILILINGERVAASTGSTVDLSQIAVSDVQQIEIVKGASSALYGSSAMGGVINVITKTPETGWHGSVTGSVGEIGEKQRDAAKDLDRHEIKADLSYKAENFWLFSNIDIRNSEGFEIENQGRKITGPDGYKNNYSLGIGAKPSDKASLQISQHVYRQDHVIYDSVKIPGQESLDYQEQLDTNRTRFVADWISSEVLTFKLQAFTEDYKNITENSIKRQSDIQSNNIDLQNEWKISDFYSLTSGINFNSETLKQINNGDSELEGADCRDDNTCGREAKELYVQADAFVTDSIEVLAGFRYQDDENFGSHASPKISAMLRKDDGVYQQRYRASIGDGYRVPNLKERYFIFDHSHLGYKVIGNPSLDPETIISYQLGYEISYEKQWLIETNIFYNDMKDFIQESYKETISSSDSLVAIFEYQNIVESRTYGFELSAYYQFLKYRINGSYQNLKTEDKLTGLALEKNPEHLVKLSIERKLWGEKSSLLLQSQYQSESYVDGENLLKSPSFQVWDIKFDYKINQEFKVFSGVDNISDEHRDPVIASNDLRPVPGRILYVGAKYQF